MIPLPILRGDPAADAAQTLRAGPLSLVFENGGLRYLRLGETEVVRRIYVAVRDRNWGTVPPVFRNLQIEAGEDAFDIQFDVENRQDAIDFAWHGRIRGDAAGRLSLEMDGAARTSFWRNRIGFCVLLPAACAGQPCRVQHLDGSVDSGPLPVDIDANQPVRPFTAMRRLEYGLPGCDWRAGVLFGGDEFEMEDQRNWTDASFKIFSTPLALPFPVLVPAGARVTQTIEIDLLPPPGAVQAPASGRRVSETAVRFSMDAALPPRPLPEIGLGAASHGRPLGPVELKRLKALHLRHLRVDLPLSDPAYPQRLQQAAEEARALGAALELAVFVSPDMESELAGLRAWLERLQPPLARVLVYPAAERYQGGSPTAAAVQAARACLGLADAVPLGCGTNSDYIFLKRTPQPLDQVDCLAVSLNPQVHAFDNASLVETLEAQAAMLASTRRLGQGKPVVISPITLKPRHNPYATGAAPALPPDVLPPQVDLRQLSLFAAGWTLGSLRAMVVGEAASVTYYETSGWRGVMEPPGGSPLPAVFPSLPGAVFPLYHVFAAVGQFACPPEPLQAPAAAPGVSAQTLLCDRPLQASGLLLRRGSKRRLLLASHSPQQLSVGLDGLPDPAWLRLLDETTAEAAMRSFEAFWVQSPERCQPGAPGHIELALRPYALAVLDFDEEGVD